MKLRIKGNSLRLRLLRREVEQFGKTGRVTETIHFGASAHVQLSYILETDSEAKQITARYGDNRITVTVPGDTAQNWVESEKVSLKAVQPIESDKPDSATENFLTILIEKDFVCLDRKDDADNADAFPHPTGKCG